MKLSKVISLLVIAGVIVVLVVQEFFRNPYQEKPADGCVYCHRPDRDPSPSIPSLSWDVLSAT